MGYRFMSVNMFLILFFGFMGIIHPTPVLSQSDNTIKQRIESKAAQNSNLRAAKVNINGKHRGNIDFSRDFGTGGTADDCIHVNRTAHFL